MTECWEKICGDNFVSEELNFLNFDFQVFYYFHFFALT